MREDDNTPTILTKPRTQNGNLCTRITLRELVTIPITFYCNTRATVYWCNPDTQCTMKNSGWWNTKWILILAHKIQHSALNRSKEYTIECHLVFMVHNTPVNGFLISVTHTHGPVGVLLWHQFVNPCKTAL